MSYPKDLNQDISYNLNPLGPLPRVGKYAETGPVQHFPQQTPAADTDSFQYVSSELPRERYDLDANCLGRVFDDQIPSEPCARVVDDSSSSNRPPRSTASKDPDSEDVILRQFIDLLKQNNGDDGNLDRHLSLACESKKARIGESDLYRKVLEKTFKRRTGSSRSKMLHRGGACDSCKRRKAKCTAETPACSSCLKSGRECVYSQPKQGDRLRTVEARLAELEERLSQGDAKSSGMPSNGLDHDVLW